jgi:hypothetical protein
MRKSLFSIWDSHTPRMGSNLAMRILETESTRADFISGIELNGRP